MKSILPIIAIIFLTEALFSQIDYKAEAERLYNSNRLEEAVKAVNKYISENPGDSRGLFLRAQCYEDKEDYENAILDYTRSVKLEPDNPEIMTRLKEVKDKNRTLQLGKIKGYEREIEIDPDKPVNYLEIAKCYKSIEEWKLSEEWYDKYIKMEKPSPDEVIRFSEVLAKNNSLEKGEKILREYVNAYPADQRLWSRYGYFTLWLGKKQTAINAFTKALEIKPFFTEAQDGLDMASNRPYVFMHIISPYERTRTYEYPIDKYYRLLRKQPENDEVRFSLIDELIKHRRYDEAMVQVNYIFGGNIEDPQYLALTDSIRSKQKDYYETILAKYLSGGMSLTEKSIIEIAGIYENLGRRDESLRIMENFLANNKGAFPNLRYKYAQYLAYNEEYEKADKQLAFLLYRYPDNLDYQFLRAQLLVWSLRDLDLAESYLNNIVRRDPERVEAILLLSSINSWNKNFSKSKEYLAIAEVLDPNNKNLNAAEDEYNQRLLLYTASKNYKILEEARSYAIDSDFKNAIIKYNEYFEKTEKPSKEEYFEYADMYIKMNKEDKAIEIYDKMLARGYDFDAAFLRAKHLLWSGDSVKAYDEFSKLYESNPENYDVALYYGESLHKLKRYDEAREVYENLLAKSETEQQKNNINLRLSWLPKESSGGLSIGEYVGISPYFLSYSDNIDFKYSSIGVRGETSITNWLSVGATIAQGNVGSNATRQDFNLYKANFNMRYRNASGFLSLGRFKLRNGRYTGVTEAGMKLSIENKSAFSFAYERNDGAALLYSPNVVNENIRVKLYRIAFSHKTASNVSIGLNYHKLDISDGNSGNEFTAKIGKLIQPDLELGYMYYNLGYKYSVVNDYGAPLYYSPNKFEYHSAWGSWEAYNKDKLTLKLNGKLGLDFSSDTVIREITLNCKYNLSPQIDLNSEFTYGGSYRYYSEYTYTSVYITLGMAL